MKRLVHSDRLSQSEKDDDRFTALAMLKLILSLGYRIDKG